MKKTLLAALAFVLLASPAFAHAHLVSAVPADGATVNAASSITIHFSEDLTLEFTGIVLTDANGAVPLGAASLDPADPKTLTVALPAALPAGKYTVAWHALSTDGHKTTGAYTFSVK